MLEYRKEMIDKGIYRDKWIVTCWLGENKVYNIGVDECEISTLLNADKDEIISNSLTMFIYFYIEKDLLSKSEVSNYLH